MRGPLLPFGVMAPQRDTRTTIVESTDHWRTGALGLNLDYRLTVGVAPRLGWWERDVDVGMEIEMDVWDDPL